MADTIAALTASSLLAKAKELTPAIAEAAARNEALGRLGDDTVKLMREAGFFSLMIPASLGGADATPTEALQVLEQLAYADGSAGWVAMAAGCCTGMAAGYLSDAGIEAIFAKGHPIIAGQGAGNGRAVVDGNGYRVSGHWSYGSGTLHADYFHSGAIVVKDGQPMMAPNGHPLHVTTLVPKDEVEVAGNWDVMGLKATGSVDYEIRDVFIPAEYCHPPDSTDALRGGCLFRTGIIGLTAIGHTGFTLGIARRALDEIAAFARKRPPGRGHIPSIADTGTFHEAYATAEAKARATRAFVFETWHDIEETLARGDKMSTRQITLLRLALNYITTATVEIVDFAYKAGGGTALRASAIQRCFRDMHAGTQHFSTRDAVLRDCGRELAGLAEGQEWNIVGLIDRH